MPAPAITVAIWLPPELSSSSKVTIRMLLCCLAHATYGSMAPWSQVSPCATVPSCMSCCRFGTTNDTLGSVE